ncbi:hypothetical protein ADK67_39640 [Saccharothrix sp. NRRL B-16348]|uniref:hypothetical protein n=1 Tax=Saccharothrix sp. NRRL B-16348 TaxID=1415542 RepID=UPI0006AFA5DE|nr:hypothetical protein [Saccharothrix sp. NRRL B-16348]KOX16823.1 hypothetical protein ADK67_39640 [Saccharothrix sp. NRRL B-16348]
MKELSRREVALLRATVANRVDLTRSAEPDVRVDGLPFCDPTTARALVHAGLIEATTPVAPGDHAPARLTAAGAAALGLAVLAA